MPTSIKKIAIIGMGVIGTGWSLRFLAHNKEIYVFDPSINQKQFLTLNYYSHIIHTMISEGVLICRIVVPFIPVVQPQIKR